MFSNKHMNPYI